MAHKYTKYDELGGFPLTLDDLQHDRTGLYEAIAAFCADGDTTPMVLSGDLGGSAWIVIAGEILPFTAPVVMPPLGAGESYWVAPSQTAVTVTYEDLTTHNTAEIVRTAGIVVASSAPTGGVLLSDFVLWHQVFGARAKSSWLTLGGTTAQMDWNLSYRKNVLTNTLHLKGTVTVKSGASTSNNYYGLGTLDAIYRPTSKAPFNAHFRYHGSSLKENSLVDYVDVLNAELDPSGLLSIGLRKPDTAIASSYIVYINAIIPLD